MGATGENPAHRSHRERGHTADRTRFRNSVGTVAATRHASAFAHSFVGVDSGGDAHHGRAWHHHRIGERSASRTRGAVTSRQGGDGGPRRRECVKFNTPWSLLAPLGVSLLLAAWIALSAANIQAASFSLLIYGLANLIVYTDALDFILRLHVRRRHIATAPTEENRHLSIDLTAALPASARQVVPVRPYAIIASIHNLEPLLDEFMDAFAAYRDKVWLISDGSTDATVLRLRHAGWRCFDDGVNRHKPGAIKRLLERIPPHIETLMVVDPDIRIRDKNGGSRIDFERFIRDFQQSGAAAVCPRVMIEPDGFLA